MAIENRDLSGNEQRVVLYYEKLTNTVQGSTDVRVAGPLPYPCKLIGIQTEATGISGAALGHFRKVIGNGSSFGLGISVGVSALAFQNFGVSGTIGYSGLAVPGSTLLNFTTGDKLVVDVSGGSQIATFAMNLIFQKVQDITSYDNFPTVS